MSSASRITPHYTVADYEQWRGDWELWDGHPIAMSPSPGVRHQRVAKKLLYAIEKALAEYDECQCELLYEVDWRVNSDTVYRPDLLIICEPVTTTWIESPPKLVVEVVSPGTVKSDREFKRTRYAENGVANYLIVDPMSQQIETLRLIDSAYQKADPSSLQLHEGCVLSLDLTSIWA